MQFSMIFEAQLADPTRENEQQVLRDGVEQAILAEQMGFDRVWAVEHHALEWYAHMSAPEIFLTYVAAKTTRLRVGHGVVCLPFAMNHPIRVAERIAMLDILSGGRVDFGVGRGATMQETGAFGIEPSDTQPQLEESIQMIPRMWCDDVFEWRGSLLRVPPRPIRPRPVQQPHPPLFLACTRDETLQLAGRWGLGALCLGFNGPEDIGRKRRIYEAAIEAADPCQRIGAAATRHVSALCPAVVLDDRDQARKIGLRGQRFFVDALEHWYGKGEPPRLHGEDEDDEAALRESEEVVVVTHFGSEKIVSGRTGKHNTDQPYGNASDVIEYVERLRDQGADEVMFLLQMGGIPQSVVMESIRNIGTKIIPRFRRGA